ncbi:MAG: type II secretion system protein [Candidatus Omnitrophota bacterium]|nr:type II secretion system protein [Candidatus Omnitrophota bacterium]
MIKEINQLNCKDHLSLKKHCNQRPFQMLNLFQSFNSAGFTLMELMIAAMILAFVLVSLLASFIACLDLVEISKNTSIAINNAQNKLEEIKNTSYAQIKNNYNNIAFNVVGITGKGVSYVDDTNPELLEVMISISWKQRNGRIIGEDLNLNGALNVGEDTNANGKLDSPAEIVTYIAAP